MSRIESIFQLETLAASRDCSDPEKKYFLLLVRLARETVVAVREPSLQTSLDLVLGKHVLVLWPAPKTARLLRQRLIRALEEYRCALLFYQSVAHGINALSRSSNLDSLEDTIGEACSVCAEAISKCIHDSARGDAYLHILETVYLAVVFVLRSIHELADRGRTTANRHIYMVVQTIASWIDAIVYRCLHGSRIFCERFDINKMEARMAFVSLGLLYVSVPDYLSFN